MQLIDLGAAPPSNSFNSSQDAPEQHYPLRVLFCSLCGLAQTDITLFNLHHDQIFTEQYPYFSSTSKQWVAHARDLVDRMSEELQLGADSLTVEVGSNDGYLLQWVQNKCYGIEPTHTRYKAWHKDIEVVPAFFNEKLALSLIDFKGQADWMVCNNVLAHVPDINGFVRGFAALMKPDGVATFEFPSLVNLIRHCQFDTIYHEHYSYLSLTAVANILFRNGLQAFNVEKLATHGGSLRVFAQHKNGQRPLNESVAQAILDEYELIYPSFFEDFQARADRIKNDLTSFLLQVKTSGKTIAGFGAAAKANTLLNYAGIRADLLPYVVDDTPSKQGKFMPGSRIPVLANFTDQPDYILIFPWNFRDEIMQRLVRERSLGAKLVFAIPKLEIVPALEMARCA